MGFDGDTIINATGQTVSIGFETGVPTNRGLYLGYRAGKTNPGDYAVGIGSTAAEQNQSIGALAIGHECGQYDQGQFSIALGYNTGRKTQNNYSIAVGHQAGNDGQAIRCVALGTTAGKRGQKRYSVAVGNNAGSLDQGEDCVGIGNAGGFTGQNNYSTAVGSQAGYSGQKEGAVAIGREAGRDNQGTAAVAIGRDAGRNSQHDNTIILNATGSDFDSSNAGAFYVNPIRSVNYTSNILAFNTGDNEVCLASNVGIAGDIVANAFFDHTGSIIGGGGGASSNLHQVLEFGNVSSNTITVGGLVTTTPKGTSTISANTISINQTSLSYKISNISTSHSIYSIEWSNLVLGAQHICSVEASSDIEIASNMNSSGIKSSFTSNISVGNGNVAVMTLFYDGLHKYLNCLEYY